MHALELPLEICLFSPIYWYEVVYFILWLYLFYTTLFFKLFQLWTFEVFSIDFCILLLCPSPHSLLRTFSFLGFVF